MAQARSNVTLLRNGCNTAVPDDTVPPDSYGLRTTNDH
jgi:hypothetical protein